MVERDARRFLAALAGRGSVDGDTQGPAATHSEYRDRIDRATAAAEDFETATRFLDEYDLAALEAAIERAEQDLSVRADAGRDALETLRALQRAAVGQGQFQSGSSPLGSDDIAAHG